MRTESSDSNSFERRSAIYVVASTFQKLSTLLLLPLYTALLTPAEYGFLNLIVVFVLFAGTVSLLGTDFAVLKYCHPAAESDGENATRASYFTSALVLVTTTSFALLVLLLVTSPLYSGLIFPDLPFFPVVMTGLFAITGQAVTSLALALMQTTGRATAFAAYSLGQFLLTAALTLLFVGPADLGVLGAAIALAVANTAIALVAVIHAARLGLLTRSHDRASFRELLAYATPMMPHSVSLQAAGLATRVVVTNVAGIVAVGLFNIAMYAVNVIDAVQTALHRAFLPWYFEIASTKPKGWVQRAQGMIASFVAINTVVAILITLFTAELLALLTPTSYHQAALFVPLLALSMLVKAVYYPQLTVLLQQSRGTRAVLQISLISILVSVALAVWLGWWLGIIGVLISQVCQRLLMSGMAVYSTRKSGGAPIPWARVLRIQGIGVVTILLTHFAQQAGWWGMEWLLVFAAKCTTAVVTISVILALERSVLTSIRKVVKRGT